LATCPTLLLLDEVGAGLDLAEVSQLVRILKDIHQEGITLIIVEHIMEIIMHIAENVIVLCEGRKIAEGPPNFVSKDITVVSSYLGDMQH